MRTLSKPPTQLDLDGPARAERRRHRPTIDEFTLTIEQYHQLRDDEDPPEIVRLHQTAWPDAA